MNIAIITIGRRDIQLVNDQLPHQEKQCRKNGLFLIENFARLKNKISLPIIQPFLNYLSERSIKIDKFLLIATDQKEKPFTESDTINFAKVLKRYLERSNAKVAIIALKKNVNDFNYNYNFFQKSFSVKQQKMIEKVYLLPVGGLPNINTPILMASILLFKEKVEQFYVDEKRSNCLPVPFSKKLLKTIENERVKTALDSYFFASIKDICSDKFIRMIADYAYNRLSFNLAKAKLIADDMIMEFPNENLAFMSESITDIRNSFQEKIKEIFFTAVIKIKQQQYIDALLRLYSFTDNLLLQRVCKLYNLEYDSDKNFQNWWNKMSKKLTENNPNIKDKLGLINDSKANLKKPGVPLYNELIKIKQENDEIFQITKPLIALSDLRNKSIAAHGFEGVCLEQINEKLIDYGLDIESLIKLIETFLKTNLSDSIYSKFQNMIAIRLTKNY